MRWAWGPQSMILGVLSAGVASAQTITVVDPKLPTYTPVAGVSGKIKSVGSDTMSNLMTSWMQGFKKFYPGVQEEVQEPGSAQAPPALIAGTASFGPMSRAMKPKEMDSFEKKFGYPPTALRSSIDMLAVFVNKDNPIDRLTLAQVDAIFSKNRKRGFEKEVRVWSDLGQTGFFAGKNINLFGRNPASGTYTFFKEVVMENGDFKDEVKAQPGSSSVVQGVATDRLAIGYSGIGYATADVRVVPLIEKEGDAPIKALAENAYNGSYPLARFLYLYVNYKPESELDPLRREFIRFVFSKQGQELVIKNGFVPVEAETARADLVSVKIKADF